MEIKDVIQLNGLTLAYIGDAAWEIKVRQHLIEKGLRRPKELHQQATQFVSAVAQEKLMTILQNEEVLSEVELTIFKRGRNSKSHSSAKNAGVGTYRIATGFEALFGYLYLADPSERFEQLAAQCIENVEANAFGE